MIKVFAWPPVGVVGHEWTEEAPIQRSRSILTGKDYISAYSRKRRRVTLTVSALAKQRSGAGYMEMLKRYLDGGINAVRLYSHPVNWWQDAEASRDFLRAQLLSWQMPPVGLSWLEQSSELFWFSGSIRSGTRQTQGGKFTVVASGFPPDILIARPGDVVRAYSNTSPLQTAAALVSMPSYSSSAGTAVIYLESQLPFSNVLSIGDSETAVFRPESLPRAVQPLNSDWNYTWDFREIFSDEVGGFEEVDPWQ